MYLGLSLLKPGIIRVNNVHRVFRCVMALVGESGGDVDVVVAGFPDRTPTNFARTELQFYHDVKGRRA